MLHTITLIIIAIIFGIYTIRFIESINHGKINITYAIVAILAIIIILANNKLVEKSYKEGYDAAIQSAEFYKFSNDGYFIQFGDDIHEYKF